ncbi:MAG TPA: hypothetical protein VLF68_05240 [Candidatus Saccharimonadales bacterium]|nr:hypothetical protein [Candidatus Saccharimonadales bacterium]
MITIIHGDDTTSSRNYVQEQRVKNDFVSLTWENISTENLTQIFEGEGLFENSKKVLIENFFAKKGKISKETQALVDLINLHGKEHEIIFWEGKEFGKQAISLFPKADIKLFKLPKTIFSFLDNISPNNAKQSVSLFHQTIANTSEDLVLFMLIKQIRMLLTLSDRTSQAIDETAYLAPWQRSKLERQAKLFTPMQLKTIYGKLFELDLGQKTGALSAPLEKSIDFLLLEI